MSNRRRKARRFVTALALLCASALLVLLIGGEALLGRRIFTDGSGAAVPQSVWEGAARFAWADRGQLPAPLGAPEGEAEPAIGPGHPDLYFARRADGVDAHWDLFRARWSADGYASPEPLFELNTGRNERDPHLIRGGTMLVFSSDRPGGEGGYDLYGAAVREDGLGEPINLGKPLNSKEDDRAPSSDLYGRRMVFASTRLAVDRVSFDLFETESLGGKWSEPQLISSLQKEDDGETRAPALSPDGRFLVFASDRAEGAGGYDLYRSVYHDGRWRRPVPLVELNTELDETDATFSPEGTWMLFARTRADGDGFTMDLHQAERRELVPINDGDNDLWSRLLALLAALLAILLLTYLGLYWQGIHPFVKFILLSVLVHLLILLYMHGSKPLEFEGGGGGDQAFLVSFMPSKDDGESSDAQGQQAQGDQVAPSERGFAQPVAQQAERAAPVAPSAEPSQALVAERAATESTLEDMAEAEAPGRQTEAQQSRVVAPSAAALDASDRKTGSDPSAGDAVAQATSTAVGRTESNPSSTRGSTAAASAATSPGELDAEAATPAPGRSGRAEVAEAAPSGARAAARDTASAAPAPRALAEVARDRGSRKSATDKAGVSAVVNASPIGSKRMESSAGVPASQRGAITPSAATSTSPSEPAAGDLVAQRNAGVSAPTPDGPSTSVPRGARAARPSFSLSGGAREAVARAPGAAATDPEPTSGGPEQARELASGPRVEAMASVSGRRRAETVTSSNVKGPSPAMLDTRRTAGPPASLPTRGAREAVARSRAPSRPGLARSKAMERGPETFGPAVPAEAADRIRKPARLDVARLAATLPGSGRGRRPTPMEGWSHGLAAPPGGDLIQARHAAIGARAPVARATVHAQRTGKAKLAALKRGGGSAETERAVLGGLRYLRSIQRRTGGWGRNTQHDKYGDFRLGKTGLALLAFLGSGYTHQEDGEFKQTVINGLDFILQRQDRRTGHFGDSAAYGHGIATYALAEAYAMTRDPRLRSPLRRAVRRILDAQARSQNKRIDGGWPYFYKNPERSYDRWPRMSVTVWQVMALKSAKIGGIDVPRDALTRARSFVLNGHDRRLEAFRYNHDPEWLQNAYPTLPGTTPAALFALQLLGADNKDPRYQTALTYVDRRPVMPQWRRYSDRQFATQGLSNLYYLYYATLGLFFEGGDRWTRWNGRLTNLLVRSQSRDGSWRPISYYAEYCADSDQDRAYTTAMCVLMLEVYYRYFTPLLTSMEGK